MTDFRFPTDLSELEQHYTVLKKRFVNDRLLSEDDFVLLIELLNGSCRGVLDLHADFAASTSALADGLAVLTDTQRGHTHELAQCAAQLGTLSTRLQALEDGLSHLVQRFDEAQQSQLQRENAQQMALDTQAAAMMPVRTLLAQQDRISLDMAQRLQALEMRMPVIVPEAVESAPAPLAVAEAAPVIVLEAVESAPAPLAVAETAPVMVPEAVESAPAPLAVAETAPVMVLEAVESAPAPLAVAETAPVMVLEAVETAPAPLAVAETAPVMVPEAVESAPAPLAVAEAAPVMVPEAVETAPAPLAVVETAPVIATEATAPVPEATASPLRRLMETLASLSGGRNG